MTASTGLHLDGHSLTLSDLVRLEAERPHLILADSARGRMRQSVETVAEVVRTERVCYGINTGFGAFANRHIPDSQVIELQYNLARSHTCGVGPALPAEDAKPRSSLAGAL